jgi:hypothetical protein
LSWRTRTIAADRRQAIAATARSPPITHRQRTLIDPRSAALRRRAARTRDRVIKRALDEAGRPRHELDTALSAGHAHVRVLDGVSDPSADRGQVTARTATPRSGGLIQIDAKEDDSPERTGVSRAATIRKVPEAVPGF